MLIDAVINVSISPKIIESQFWDIKSWSEIWSPIEKINLRYEDEIHQEVMMQVNRDGKSEINRTFRFRDQDKLTIEFFSPLPPPMMLKHTGKWIFQKKTKGTKIIAVREYTLFRDKAEDDESFNRRNNDFKSHFQIRLNKILEKFKRIIEFRSDLYV